MGKREKTQEDLNDAYLAQIHFLKDACKQYDSGREDYAVKIAECLRVLVIDTKKMKSLLTHTGQNDIKILDTSAPRGAISFYRLNNVSNLYIMVENTYIALVQKNCNAGVWSFVPLLDCNHEAVSISLQDWLGKVIYEDGTSQLSRKNLIRAIAETDGGAHVDDTEDEELYKLKQLSALNLSVNGTIVNFRNKPAYASIRQIAFELLYSLPTCE